MYIFIVCEWYCSSNAYYKQQISFWTSCGETKNWEKPQLKKTRHVYRCKYVNKSKNRQTKTKQKNPLILILYSNTQYVWGDSGVRTAALHQWQNSVTYISWTAVWNDLFSTLTVLLNIPVFSLWSWDSPASYSF